MIGAGQLDKRVTLQQRAAGRAASGQPDGAWQTVATVWANVRHPSGSEAIRADADLSIVKASIRIRRRTDVHAGMRVVHGSAVYQVHAVLQPQDRAFTDLVCEQGGRHG